MVSRENKNNAYAYFQFLLGLTMVPRENKNNAYAKFGRLNKEYYGIFQSGLLEFRAHPGGNTTFDTN